MDAAGAAPEILIVSPPPILDNVMQTRHAPIFGEESAEISRQLPAELLRVSKLQRCEFINAAPYAEVSPIDAVHMTREGHLALARAISDKVKELI